MKPRILYTTADASPQSGAFRCMLTVSRGVAQYGYEPILALHREARGVTNLALDDRQRVCFFGLPRAKRGQHLVYYLSYTSQNIRSVYELVRFIRREQISLVHVNEVLDFYGGLAAKIAGVPCVWHVRANLDMVPWLQWWLSRMIFTLATMVIVPSQSVYKRMFMEQGGQKIIVLYEAGPDPVEFNQSVDGSCVREEFGVAENAFLITLVAKLSERKGHETLVRAAPMILAAFPNTHFMIVGGELEGDRYHKYAKELRMLPHTLGMQNRIIFTGFRSDIPQIMAASDIITHCSTYPDPFPGVVLQGMAVGKPVVASNLGGSCEQIEDGVSGLLTEPGDPRALAEAICTLLGSAERRRVIGWSAIERAKRFSDQAFLEGLEKIYSQVMDEVAEARI